MDYTSRYSARSNLESSATAYTVPIGYQLNYKPHWQNTMYSMQNLDCPRKSQLLRESIDKNKTNFNFWMYSSKQSLNSNNIPKKETLWQSMFRSATNLLGEQLTRGTSSLIKNWSNMNNPLSVTVVSPDFYKSVHQEKEHQLINSSEEFIVSRSWSKESHISDDKLPKVLYDNEIMSERAKKNNSDSNDSDKRWKEYKNMYVDFNKSQEKDSVKNEQIVNSVNNSDCKDEDLESHFNIIIIDEKEVDDEPFLIEKPDELTPEIRQEQSAEASQKSTSVTTMLTNAYNKVVSGMADYLQVGGQTTPESEPESDFELTCAITKRSCPPKTRPKRLHDVSSGRGRGRAKSQLRRSGVSQTRHRKERNKYDLKADIKSDMNNWEELKFCAEDLDECDYASEQHNEDIVQQTNFTFGDVKLKRHKPKKSQSSMWAEIALVPQDLDEVGGEFKDGFREKPVIRSRLLSESSVDSEDSYCIVFEGDSCNDECDFETDVDDYTEPDETETDEEEILPDPALGSNRTKVRFNLMPIVHTMIQWNYAYRAARRGPWEEMARDRERFRSRIDCIGRVLEPVLADQHRMRVWHERFNNQNIVL